MISLAEYLDREECRERPEKECLRLVIDLHGETVADNINWLMKHAPESSELYDALSLPLGDFTFYDTVKGRFRRTVEYVLRRISNYLPKDAPSRIADFGCSSGLEAVFLAGTYPLAQVYGIDASSKMIKEAQKRQAKYELNNIKFRHGSMEETELEAGTFDLIYAISSLNKDNYETTFDEALRLLKRGGRMCALYPGINLSIPRVAVDRGMKVEVKKSDTVVKAGKVSYSFMCAEKA